MCRLLIAWLVLIGMIQAQSEMGVVVEVKGQVKLIRNDKEIVLTENELILAGDRVQAGKSARTMVLLNNFQEKVIENGQSCTFNGGDSEKKSDIEYYIHSKIQGGITQKVGVVKGQVRGIGDAGKLFLEPGNQNLIPENLIFNWYIQGSVVEQFLFSLKNDNNEEQIHLNLSEQQFTLDLVSEKDGKLNFKTREKEYSLKSNERYWLELRYIDNEGGEHQLTGWIRFLPSDERRELDEFVRKLSGEELSLGSRQLLISRYMDEKNIYYNDRILAQLTNGN